MEYQHSKRYCPNGHCVEDDQLNFCPECGLLLSSDPPEQKNQQSGNGPNTEPCNFEQNEPPKQKKKPVGYIVLSAIIVVLVFVILELTDTTNFIPSLHSTKQAAYKGEAGERAEDVKEPVKEKKEDDWATGICGDNLTWSYRDGTLEIVGTGAMLSEYELRFKTVNPFSLEKYKPYIETVILPDGLTRICRYAFDGCEKLKRITIPASVKVIEKYAYKNCSSLTDVIIPEGVEELESGAFEGCSSLTTVILPESIKKIGESCFENCTGLAEMVIPEGVEELEGGVFEGCSSLTTVILPESIKKIGESCFEKCTGLTEIVIPEGVEELQAWAFLNCKSLITINLPEGLKEIGKRCFWGCTGIVEMTIPDSVQHIGDYAFGNCNESFAVHIPNNEYIKEYVRKYNVPIFAEESSRAEMDAANNIVPGFGMSRTQVKEKMNLIFNASDLWAYTNDFPYQKMSEFPLLPNMDFATKDYSEYFGPGTFALYYMYNLDSGTFEKIDRADAYYFDYGANVIVYHIRATPDFVPGKLIGNGIKICSADGYYLSYDVGNCSFDPENELVSALLKIQIIKYNAWQLNVGFEYLNHVYPDCPISIPSDVYKYGGA